MMPRLGRSGGSFHLRATPGRRQWPIRDHPIVVCDGTPLAEWPRAFDDPSPRHLIIKNPTVKHGHFQDTHGPAAHVAGPLGVHDLGAMIRAHFWLRQYTVPQLSVGSLSAHGMRPVVRPAATELERFMLSAIHTSM